MSGVAGVTPRFVVDTIDFMVPACGLGPMIEPACEVLGRDPATVYRRRVMARREIYDVAHFDEIIAIANAYRDAIEDHRPVTPAVELLGYGRRGRAVERARAHAQLPPTNQGRKNATTF